MGFAINTRDGRVSVWVEGVSNCCYAPIPDDIAAGVNDGSIKWEDVINAINKKRFMDKDFDWTALRSSEEQLNVRTSKFEFADKDESDDKGQDKEDKNAISMSDLVESCKDGDKVTKGMVDGKKATSRKYKPDKDATLDIFDDGAPEEEK